MILVDGGKIEIKSDKQILKEARSSCRLDGDTIDCTKCKANIRKQLRKLKGGDVWDRNIIE